MDEMAVKQGLSYDGKRDLVEGFVDESQTLLNRVHRWKQPFGLFYSSGPISAPRMKVLLFEAINHLESIGLVVIVVISDKGSNNISLFQTHLKVTVNRPFFSCGQKNVCVMYDPPHVKNVRNNLRKHGFLVNGHQVSWKHIREFYEAHSSKPTRLAPKLTRRHLELQPFSTLHVKLATQVLSHYVATGTRVMAQWGIIHENAAHTAEFLDNFDQLFNTFNSATSKSSAQMKHAFSATPGHIAFLREKLVWLQEIKSKKNCSRL